MKTPLNIAAAFTLGILFSPPLRAQTVTEGPKPDPVLEAIEKFEENNFSLPRDVKVVLDPAPESESNAPTSTPPAPKPPAVGNSNVPEVPEISNPAVVGEKAAAKHSEGLSVRIETLQTATSKVHPKDIKLLAPFPAKPLSQPPSGWQLLASETAPPFIREVEVAPGSKVTLTIRPHFLVPDSNAADVFAIAEPGYDGSLGYQQSATVGAVLAGSVAQLENQSLQLGKAIEGLQQLLISLPKPEITPPVNRPNTPPKK